MGLSNQVMQTYTHNRNFTFIKVACFNDVHQETSCINYQSYKAKYGMFSTSIT